MTLNEKIESIRSEGQEYMKKLTKKKEQALKNGELYKETPEESKKIQVMQKKELYPESFLSDIEKAKYEQQLQNLWTKPLK